MAHYGRSGNNFTPEEFVSLCEKHNFKCVCCGAREQAATRGYLTGDHIIPIYAGGTNSIDNIQPLCWDCNVKHKNRSIDQ